MSEKTARMIRKGINQLGHTQEEIADNLVKQLFESPFKYRFIFAMKLIFRRKKK